MMVFVTVCTFACEKEAKKEEGQTIRLVYANWSEGVAMTHLAAEILEDELGYQTITKMAEIESVFKEIEGQNYDVFVDAWLPETHGEYLQEYGAESEDLGTNVRQVNTGLLVPDYVEIQSIAELETATDTIVGIGAGAGIMSAAASAIDVYDLSTYLREGSEASMTEALMNAIKKRETIVVTGWAPHWIYNRYDLRFLDDPKKVFGDSEEIHTIARNGFTADHPRAALFFERFRLTEEQLGSLMDEVQAFPNDERRAIQNWIDENEFIVNGWVRGLEPEREKVM